MELAAAFFGAGRTWFLTNGATGGLLALFTGLVGRGRKVILPRTSHLAVSHALALLDLVPVWLEFDETASRPFAFLPPVTAESVAAAVARHPDSAVVFLTSPDYYGCTADLAAIARVAHQAGMLLLVDEAHGAHLAAAPDLLPPTALACGADACVQSAHKTLPALTQGAFLHLAPAKAADEEAVSRLNAAVRIFQTSSPSFAIAASLDLARAWLEQSGHGLIERLLTQIDRLATRLEPDFLVTPATRDLADGLVRDPTRLVLRPLAWPGRTAVELAGYLSRLGIDVEMADLTRLILIPALDQPPRDFSRLARQLTELSRTAPEPDRPAVSPQTVAALEQSFRQALVRPPVRALPAGSVFPGCAGCSPAVQSVPLRQADGRIAARLVAAYPPGIPLLLPGERFSRDLIDLLAQLRDNNLNLTGVTEDQVQVIA